MSDPNRLAEQRVQCEFCDRTFGSVRGLKTHCSRVHSLETEAGKAGFVSARVLHEEDDEELAALAEDCERDMYGDDYDYLKDCGWLDR